MSEWYVKINEKTHGPMTSKQLKDYSASGKITPETALKKGTDGQWVKASNVRGLFDVVAATKPRQLMQAVPATFSTPAKLVAAELVANTKNCPLCGETIAFSAVKCKHCGEFFDGRPIASQSSTSGPQVPMQMVVQQNTIVHANGTHKRWSRLVAMLLSFFWPGLGQIYKGQPINGLIWMFMVFVIYVISIPLFCLPGILLHLLCILGAGLGNPYK